MIDKKKILKMYNKYKKPVINKLKKGLDIYLKVMGAIFTISIICFMMTPSPEEPKTVEIYTEKPAIEEPKETLEEIEPEIETIDITEEAPEEKEEETPQPIVETPKPAPVPVQPKPAPVVEQKPIPKPVPVPVVKEEPAPAPEPKPIVKPAPEPKPAQPHQQIVYWTPNGKCYHSNKGCASLSRSKNILSGDISECGNRAPCRVCH